MEAVGYIILWVIISVLTLGIGAFFAVYYFYKSIINKTYLIGRDGQRIARLDSRHATLPSGERVATALGQALFRHIIGPKVCQMIDRGQSVTTSELPEQLFAPLARALARTETQPSIHFLAAQINLETGWARRGGATWCCCRACVTTPRAPT